MEDKITISEFRKREIELYQEYAQNLSQLIWNKLKSNIMEKEIYEVILQLIDDKLTHLLIEPEKNDTEIKKYQLIRKNIIIPNLDKIALSEDHFDFLKCWGNIVTPGGDYNPFYHLPQYFEKLNDNNIFLIYKYNQLPERIKQMFIEINNM